MEIRWPWLSQVKLTVQNTVHVFWIYIYIYISLHICKGRFETSCIDSLDMALCTPLKINRLFRGIRHLYIQGLKYAKHETSSKRLANRCLLWHILRPWRWWQNVPPKRPLTFNGLICHKMEHFITPLLSEPEFSHWPQLEFVKCCLLEMFLPYWSLTISPQFYDSRKRSFLVSNPILWHGWLRCMFAESNCSTRLGTCCLCLGTVRELSLQSLS
jgi:hypothetical protein